MQKNRVLKIASITVCAILIIFIALSAILFALGFRFTSVAAANACASLDCINTKDYDFYYLSPVEEEIKVVHAIAPVKKYGFLYKRIDDFDYTPVYLNNTETYVGVFASFQGKNCYYNFFIAYMLSDLVFSYPYEKVYVNGEETTIVAHSYFFTDEKVTRFEIQGNVLTV